MSLARHTQALVAWGMWKARQRRNAKLHTDAVQRYTGIINVTRPTLTVLSVNERYIGLQCKSCGARLTYSTRQVKRLVTHPSTASVRCKACAVKPTQPSRTRKHARSSPDAAYLHQHYAVRDGVLVYHNHSVGYDGTPFGAVRWMQKEQRERRYGYVKGCGYFYADELISIMEQPDAQEKEGRSQGDT